MANPESVSTTRPETRKYAATPADMPEGTLVELFLDSVDRYNRPDAQLYRTAEGWQPISHRQLFDDVRALSAWLSQHGFERGDRIALLSENRPEWALTDYAFLCSGILTVPIYPTLPPNQIEYILKDAGVRAFFVSTREQSAKAFELAEAVGLEHVIVFDDVANLPPIGRPLSRVLEEGRRLRGPEAEFRDAALRARPDDVATLIYTSGTTGAPKGVMLTHNNIHSNITANAWLKDQPGPHTALSFLPLSHVFQRMVDYTIFGAGIPIAYVASMDNVAHALSEVRPTIVCAVPRVFEKLYARILSATGLKRRIVLWGRKIAIAWADAVVNGRPPSAALRLQHTLADRLVFRKVRDAIGGRLQFFVSGSAPLAPQIASFFFGAGVPVYEGYGLTETSPVTNVNRPGAVRVGTVGKPVPGTEIMIAADGEILVRGPQVMKGYYKKPDETRQAIDADGWFHTGDIGDMDDDGFLRITDRKKELIVTAGGKNIAPQPIENLAKLSRFVAEAMLIGDRRPYPIMLVVPNFHALESWASAQQLRWSTHAELVALAQVHEKMAGEVMQRLTGLARYELPKKFHILDREFDLLKGEITPSLKLKRKVVEANFRDVIESLYAGSTPEDAASR